jgi:ribonuclease Z
MRARTRRAFSVIAALSLCGSAILGCDRIIDAQIERGLTRDRTSILRAPGLHVELCGTGSPLPDPDRASACTAVVAGGHLLLFDVGPGAWKQVDLEDLPTSALAAVFLTHFHSDHIGDLGEAITQSWIAGRTEPLEVVGPPGTAEVVAGFAEAYAADARARVAHHGEAALPAAGATAVAHEGPAFEGVDAEPIGVWERDGVRVLMFPVDHRPVSPAVGYRIEYAGRSVVVSGDTRKSASVERAARGTDLLIHEALEANAVRRASSVAARLGQDRLAKLANDIPGYHTTPVEAAEVAQAAGAKKLVLTHLVPAPRNVFMRRIFLSGTGGVYDGEIVLGEDGMRFDLPPAP